MSQTCLYTSGAPPKDEYLDNLTVGNLNVVCQNNSNQLAKLQSEINTILTELENLPSDGGVSGDPFHLSKLPVIIRTGDDFLPDPRITFLQAQRTTPLNTIQKRIQLGEVVKSAWVMLNGAPGVENTVLSPPSSGYFSGQNNTNSQMWGNSLLGVVGGMGSRTNPTHTVYVTEDFAEAKRYSFQSNEYDPRGSTYYWLNDTVAKNYSDRKTYANIGNGDMLFGCYYWGTQFPVYHGNVALSVSTHYVAVPPASDYLSSPHAAPVVIKKMYLDNVSSPGNTELVFDFDIVGPYNNEGNVSDYITFACDISNNNNQAMEGPVPNIFMVYKIN